MKSTLVWHPLLEEWVTTAPWRQDRTYHPDQAACPLCPTKPGKPETEIPEPGYHIAVFENRFPTFTGSEGRCEVVCYTPEHDSSLGRQPLEQIQDLIEVWRDRFIELGALPAVKYVYIFENRGEEIGVTLSHPHGQIFAYPFIPPVIAKELRSSASYQRTNKRCLYCDVMKKEAKGPRQVAGDSRWVAFVPSFARWPHEVHLAPRRHCSDLADLGPSDLPSIASALRDVVRAYDSLFDRPMPYVMAIHQAPPGNRHRHFHQHIEFYPARRAPDKLKHPAGSEMAGAFIRDFSTLEAARQLRAHLDR